MRKIYFDKEFEDDENYGNLDENLDDNLDEEIDEETDDREYSEKDYTRYDSGDYDDESDEYEGD